MLFYVLLARVGVSIVVCFDICFFYFSLFFSMFKTRLGVIVNM